MTNATKDVVIKVRVDPQQHAELVYAAKRSNLAISAWLRTLGLREADRLRRQPHAPAKKLA